MTTKLKKEVYELCKEWEKVMEKVMKTKEYKEYEKKQKLIFQNKKTMV